MGRTQPDQDMREGGPSQKQQQVQRLQAGNELAGLKNIKVSVDGT